MHQQEEPVRLPLAQVFLHSRWAVLATFLQQAEQDLARSAELIVREPSLMSAVWDRHGGERGDPIPAVASPVVDAEHQGPRVVAEAIRQPTVPPQKYRPAWAVVWERPLGNLQRGSAQVGGERG